MAAAGAALAAIAMAGWSPPAATAAACPNAAYRTGPSANLPDCRAYEQVSPADKGANTLTMLTTAGNQAYPSVSGDQAFFAAITPFVDPKSGGPGQYVTVRGEDGWNTRDINPVNCASDLVGFAAPFVVGFSRDFATAILMLQKQNCFDPNDHAGQDIYRLDAGGSLTWVSQSGSPKTDDVAASYAGASADAGHILFTTSQKLVPAVDAGRVSGAGLYDRTAGSTIAVGVDDAGAAVNPCGAQLAGNTRSFAPVSTDGRVIFFTSGVNPGQPGCGYADGGGQLYARIDAASTIQISKSQIGGTPTVAPKFLGATDDGTHVFFSSTDELTADATPRGGLYEYDLSKVLSGEASAGTLTFLSPDTTDASGAAVGSLASLSQDGTVRYFVAYGVLDGTSAPAPAANLYRSGPDGLTYIARLATTFPDVSASPDGSEVAFTNKAPDGTQQIYLYDASHPTSGVTCVSCPAAGATATGDAGFYGPIGNGRPASLGAERYVTDDGRVFFTSPDQLAPLDVNDHRDVYEYVNGERLLISTGTGAYDALLIGVTGDGRDVFFLTNDSLTARDFDNGDQDIYDARIGGGFPQAAVATECHGVACRPPASASPSVPVAATLSFAGPETVADAGPVSKRSTVAARVRKRMTVRRAAFRIAVRVRGKGRIAITGRGVRTVRRAARRAGTYRMRVVLNKRARKLRRARRGALHLLVRVAFKPNGGARAVKVVRVTVKRPKAGAHQHRAHRRASTKGGR